MSSGISWEGRITSNVKRAPLAARRGTDPVGGFGITRKTFDQLAEWIEDNAAAPAKLQAGLNALAYMMAIVTKAEAKRRSFGPLAPRMRSVPALAFRVPVQRITGDYYAGWTVRKTRWGYVVYNDTIEAYLIEYGMHQRVRRPVLKMSVLGTLRFMQATRAAEHLADSVFAPRRNAKGQFQSFNTRAAPFLGSSGLSGPVGRLP